MIERQMDQPHLPFVAYLRVNCNAPLEQAQDVANVSYSALRYVSGQKDILDITPKTEIGDMPGEIDSLGLVIAMYFIEDELGIEIDSNANTDFPKNVGELLKQVYAIKYG